MTARTCSAGVLAGQRGSARADGISDSEANGMSGHPQHPWLPATPINTTVVHRFPCTCHSPYRAWPLCACP